MLKMMILGFLTFLVVPSDGYGSPSALGGPGGSNDPCDPFKLLIGGSGVPCSCKPGGLDKHTLHSPIAPHSLAA